jgi:hypothetical protein
MLECNRDRERERENACYRPFSRFLVVLTEMILPSHSAPSPSVQYAVADDHTGKASEERKGEREENFGRTHSLKDSNRHGIQSSTSPVQSREC